MTIHSCLVLLLPLTVWGICNQSYEEVGDQCLFFAISSQTYAQAAADCKGNFGKLATITTPTQFKALVDYINKNSDLSKYQYWMDGSDSASEGKWVSSAGDDVAMGTPFWAGYTTFQEPNGLQTENCLILNPYQYLNDKDCSFNAMFICEGNKNDGNTVQDHSSEEDIPCRLGFENIAGECLSFHTWQYMTWSEAKVACSDDRAQLAILNDIEVLRGIYLFLHEKGLSDYDFWLGGTDGAVEGEWKWVDGSPVPMGAPFWGLKNPGGLEPDGDQNENYLALISRYYYFFRDVPNDTLCHPLCQSV